MFGAMAYIQNKTKQSFLVVDFKNKIQGLLDGLRHMPFSEGKPRHDILIAEKRSKFAVHWQG